MKRFYKEAGVEKVEGGWRVVLDGRPIKTQQGQAQVVPTEALAQAMAAEWDSQGEKIDAATLKMRDMADYAIDMVARSAGDVATKLLGYADTDTLCYRADPNEPLWRRQLEVWEPLVTAFEAREGVSLERVSGVIHRPQPTETLDGLRSRLERIDAFQLAPLEALTSLSASLCIGLSALEDDADGEALWDAANLEEDWQVEQWGEDGEAAARRARRKADFLDAMKFARLARA